MDSYSANKKISVASHEFGHNLGLAHRGSASTACADVTIMNPGDARRYQQCGVYKPRTDDIKGMSYLY
jgi:hypothetical protein